MKYNQEKNSREWGGDRHGHGRHGGWRQCEGEERRGGWRHGEEGERRGGWRHEKGEKGEDGRRGEWKHGEPGGHGDHGRGGHGGRGRGDGYASLCQEEGTHLLMIGSYSCTRHRGEERLALQQQGKLSFLCLQEIDWVIGDYLEQIEQAAAEVVKQFQVKKLILFGGCQVELQSVDTEMLTQRLSAQLNIPVEFHRGCHLVGYGNGLKEKEAEDR